MEIEKKTIDEVILESGKKKLVEASLLFGCLWHGVKEEKLTDSDYYMLFGMILMAYTCDKITKDESEAMYEKIRSIRYKEE